MTLLVNLLQVRYTLGDVTSTEWTRFQFYASFVQGLAVNQRDIVDPSVFTMLANMAAGQALFPALDCLSWTQMYGIDAGLSTIWRGKLNLLIFVAV